MKTLKMIASCIFLSCVFYSFNVSAEQLEPQSPQYYKGMPCKKDCSGHKAGYEWAIKHKIISNDACQTKSKSFNEGCSKGRENTLKELKDQTKEELSKRLQETQENL